MPPINANGLQLFYETAGDSNNPPLLLIAGLGVQMIDWADFVIHELVQAGFYVIRFDNRDIGLSTTFEGGAHDPQAVLDALLGGEDANVAYSIADMADDAAALLDALDIDSAHVVGISMGGMIAQATAIAHPNKVRTLTSIMSTTGAGDVGQPTAQAMEAILSAAPSTDRQDVIAHNLKSAAVWASPNLMDAERLEKMFNAAWDRTGGPQAENAGRQFCAIVSSPPREGDLAKLTMPVLVVHGTADTLVTPSGGERTAQVIPDATLLMIDGMGHDLPRSFMPQIADAIADLAS